MTRLAAATDAPNRPFLAEEDGSAIGVNSARRCGSPSVAGSLAISVGQEVGTTGMGTRRPIAIGTLWQ